MKLGGVRSIAEVEYLKLGVRSIAERIAEVEYRAMSSGECEEIWLHKFFSDLHQNSVIPMKLLYYNKASISIVNNLVEHDRTKHIEIDRHFVQ